MIQRATGHEIIGVNNDVQTVLINVVIFNDTYNAKACANL